MALTSDTLKGLEWRVQMAASAPAEPEPQAASEHAGPSWEQQSALRYLEELIPELEHQRAQVRTELEEAGRAYRKARVPVYPRPKDVTGKELLTRIIPALTTVAVMGLCVAGLLRANAQLPVVRFPAAYLIGAAVSFAARVSLFYLVPIVLPASLACIMIARADERRWQREAQELRTRREEALQAASHRQDGCRQMLDELNREIDLARIRLARLKARLEL
jgi:hypothetical protein